MTRSRQLLRLSAIVLLAVSAQNSWASVASEILGMTGNARAKLVFLRYPWCDSAYNPVKAYRSSDGENAHAFTQLMTFDTDKGVESYLEKSVSFHYTPRITRKDGSHVIWSDEANTCSWIQDYAGTSPRRKLIDGGDYIVVHCRYDAATDKEYIYTLAADRKRLSVIPLKADYTADIAARTTAYTASDLMKFCLGVSADGRYLGTLIPWPNTMIVDMVSGTKYNRHVDDPFGCQPNMAPDNSYRFFYLRSDHDVLRMWSPALGTDNWDVRVDKMPGNIDFNGAGYDHDCVLPRWTNDPQFFTNSYPLVIWNYSDGRIFDAGASQLKADQLKDSCGTGVFCLGKFAADFRSVEKYVRVTTCDVRKRDVVGDGWISPIKSSVGHARSQAVEQSRFAINRRGSLVVVETHNQRTGVISIVNSSGKVVALASGSGTLSCNLGDDAAGVFLVRVVSGGDVQTFRQFVKSRQ